MKNIGYVNETTTIDHGTGEIKVTSRNITKKIPAEPSFVKMYIEDIVLLNSVPSGAANLLRSLLKRVNYDNEIMVLPKVKRDIANEMGIKNVQTVDNYLGKLKDKGIVLSIDRGVYMLNPNYFAKGKWADVRKIRDKYLKLVISYEGGERKINGEL